MKTIFYTLGCMLDFILRPAAILYGWGLFVVPLGVTSITFFHAAGLSGLMTLFTSQCINIEPNTDKALIHSILLSITAVLFMKIYSLFM